jgi:hypothetical protein
MSYGVFNKSLETFAGTTVPSGPIDRRVLHDFSGADYGALMSGLRFLGLVDDARKATNQFRELVQLWKDGAKFKERMRLLLGEKYKPIVGNLNLTHGTSAELERAFKDYGVSVGQMLTKTIRFFLKAATEAGCELSPYFTAPKPRAQSTAPRKNNAGKPRSHDKGRTNDGYDGSEEVPSGFARLPLPGVTNSFIQYPTNLTEAHCQILDALVGVLRTSVQTRTGAKEPKT